MIRILTFNIHKGIGWSKKKVTLEQMREQIRLLHPDFILLQETRDTQFEFLAEEIWPHYCYGKTVVYTAGHHGNAILSKFPIVFSENFDISTTTYERRGFLHSIVQVQSLPLPLHLICVHLGLRKKDRKIQLELICDYVKATIPKHDFLVIGGDFNDWRSQATEPLIEKLGLNEAFFHHHGKYAKTFPAWIPMLKLDRLYSRGFKTVTAEPLNKEPWKSLSDHIALNVVLKPNL